MEGFQNVFIKPSYDEVRDLAYELFLKIRSSGYSEEVDVALGRGGLFAMRALQDYYVCAGRKVPYVVVSAERYSGVGRESAKELRMSQLPADDVRGKSVLVVDDVADTGTTLSRAVSACYKAGALKVMSAVIHLKPWSSYKPDFYAQKTDAWIIYPWNVYETLRQMVEEMMQKGIAPSRAAEQLSGRANIIPAELRRLKDLISFSGDSELVRYVDEVLNAYRGERGERGENGGSARD
ncbi:phosphoribosyltransferase [Tardisphaera saccharovorans]